MTTLLVGIGVLALFAALSFGGWRIHRREYHEVMRRVTKGFRKMQRVMGEQLIPAMQSAGRAFDDFAEARRASSEKEKEMNHG